jgi:hypothetical protein
MTDRKESFANSLFPFVASNLAPHRNPVTCILAGLDRQEELRARFSRARERCPAAVARTINAIVDDPMTRMDQGELAERLRLGRTAAMRAFKARYRHDVPRVQALDGALRCDATDRRGAARADGGDGCWVRRHRASHPHFSYSLRDDADVGDRRPSIAPHHERSHAGRELDEAS